MPIKNGTATHEPCVGRSQAPSRRSWCTSRRGDRIAAAPSPMPSTGAAVRKVIDPSPAASSFNSCTGLPDASTDRDGEWFARHAQLAVCPAKLLDRVQLADAQPKLRSCSSSNARRRHGTRLLPTFVDGREHDFDRPLGDLDNRQFGVGGRDNEFAPAPPRKEALQSARSPGRPAPRIAPSCTIVFIRVSDLLQKQNLQLFRLMLESIPRHPARVKFDCQSCSPSPGSRSLPGNGSTPRSASEFGIFLFDPAAGVQQQSPRSSGFARRQWRPGNSIVAPSPELRIAIRSSACGQQRNDVAVASAPALHGGQPGRHVAHAGKIRHLRVIERRRPQLGETVPCKIGGCRRNFRDAKRVARHSVVERDAIPANFERSREPEASAPAGRFPRRSQTIVFVLPAGKPTISSTICHGRPRRRLPDAAR